MCIIMYMYKMVVTYLHVYICNSVTADGGYCILEEVEETRPLTTLLDDIPTVDQLCSRLKPKMVQDPLQGDHVNHSFVFR